MAMTNKIWSVNALAVELEMDRRTVAKALAKVAPDGRTAGGHKGWHLKTALHALGLGNGRATTEPEPPPGFTAVVQVDNPVDRAILTSVLFLTYGIGPLAASMAVGAGASMKVAFALEGFMKTAFAARVCELCDAAGVKLDALNMFDPKCFDETDWEFLASLAGELTDQRTWRAWAVGRSRAVQKWAPNLMKGRAASEC